MIVLNMGIPRSGTVWAYNVFREILQREQIAFRGESPNDCAAVDAAIARRDPAENLVLHFHDVTPAVEQLARQPEVRSFFNFRDPRDVVVSQMQLHDIPLELAVEMTVIACQQLSKAATIPGVMLLPYEDIVQRPEALIFQMGMRLGLLLGRKTVDDIARCTGPERHRQLMSRLQESDSAGQDEPDRPPAGSEAGVPRDDGSPPEVETVVAAGRAIRVDTTHLVTDRHIQSGRMGRWRTELTEPQQQIVCERFAPLVARLGLPG